ncbi:TonB-dependent receptor plug domain-containing protein [candidate division KSB1 bacterium]|nr:TonB-dependent receptor plug domain-containing protein [candidate division KSB1 bacterium]
MTRIFLFVLLSSIIVSSQPKVTAQFDQVPLRTVLQEIGEQARVAFIFQDELVEGKTASLDAEQWSIDEVLERILLPHQLHYQKLTDQQIVLTAQPVDSIRGVVYDRQTGEGLARANITFKGTPHGTASDGSGYFVLADHNVEACTLTVSFVGYRPRQVLADIPASTVPLAIGLDQTVLSMPEVRVVEDKDIRMIRMDGERIALEMANSAWLPASSYADLQTRLRALPGVSAGEGERAQLSWWGASSDQVRLLLDGIPLFKSDHFYGFTGIVPASAIDSVNYFLPGQNIGVADGLAGVARLTSRSALGQPLQIEAGIDFFSGQVSASVPLSAKSGLMISLRRSYQDKEKSPVYNAVYRALPGVREPVVPSISSPAFVFADALAKFEFGKRSGFYLNATGFRATDAVDRRDNFGSYYAVQNINRWKTWGAAAEMSWPWARWARLQVQSAVSVLSSDYENDDENTYGRPYGFNQIYEKMFNEIKEFRWSISNRFRLVSNTGLHLGVKRQRFDYVLENSKTLFANTDLAIIDDPRSIRGSGRQDITANTLFANLDWHRRAWFGNVGSKVLTAEGMEREILPAIQIGYHKEHWQVDASWARQAQLLQQRFGYAIFNGLGGAWIVLDQPALSEQTTLSSSVRFASLAAQLSFFQRDIDAWPVALNDQANAYDFVNAGGHCRGVIASLSHQNVMLSYQWTRARFSSLQIDNGHSFPADALREHEFKAATTFALPKAWRVSLSGTLASGLPVTEPQMIQRMTDLAGNPVDFLQPGLHNGARLPVYHRIDLQLDKRWSVRSINIHAGVSIMNVLARVNIRDRYYLTGYGVLQNDHYMMPRLFICYAQLNWRNIK